MKKNEKIIIGVGIGVLLLLWLRNRNKPQDVLKETGGGDAGSEDGSTGGGGAIRNAGGGINPNAIGGATPVIAPVVLTAPVYAQQTLRPLPIQTGQSRERVREMAQKPMATPVSPSTNTSFARFDGSFRSPSKLDFDGHIED